MATAAPPFLCVRPHNESLPARAARVKRVGNMANNALLDKVLDKENGSLNGFRGDGPCTCSLCESEV